LITERQGRASGRVNAGLKEAPFWLMRGLLAGFFRIYCRVRVDGLGRVPSSGAFIVAPVHRSNIDFILAAMVTKRRVRFMVKHTVWRVPLLGRFIEMLGAFPVERGTADRAAMRVLEDALRAGEPVVIFPEGTRRSGNVVGPLFDGVAYVSTRTGVPIVPVGIAGSAHVMPKGARFLHPARVVVSVGEPVVPAASSGRLSRKQVREHTASLTSALQRAFDQATRDRG
jgi:1-acyl-sn-glycerol-3-phosphate acyltransferase